VSRVTCIMIAAVISILGILAFVTPIDGGSPIGLLRLAQLVRRLKRIQQPGR